MGKIQKSIVSPDSLTIFDENTHEISHGCNQIWYSTLWRRLSGCGPTVATNLILYFTRTRNSSDPNHRGFCKNECLTLMEEMWQYVTPGFSGVSNTKLFFEAVLSYAESKKIDFNYHYLDVPKAKAFRPRFSELLRFIEEALDRDAPVAFLNLCNGDETSLEKWHWVTIVSLENNPNKQGIFVTVFDNGQVKKINLSLWFHTTKKGGGFVYFVSSSRP